MKIRCGMKQMMGWLFVSLMLFMLAACAQMDDDGHGGGFVAAAGEAAMPGDDHTALSEISRLDGSKAGALAPAGEDQSASVLHDSSGDSGSPSSDSTPFVSPASSPDQGRTEQSDQSSDHSLSQSQANPSGQRSPGQDNSALSGPSSGQKPEHSAEDESSESSELSETSTGSSGIPEQPEQHEANSAEQQSVAQEVGQPDVPVAVDDVLLTIIGPEDTGTIMDMKYVKLGKDDTVLDILKRATREDKIQMEYRGSKALAYVEGIDNIYEFDHGATSGWVFTVNGELSSKSAGVHKVSEGDVIRWVYSLDLGNDAES